MGHYDNCRPGYCGACGQAEGYCSHTKPDKDAWTERFIQRLQERWSKTREQAEGWTASAAVVGDLEEMYLQYPTDPEQAADNDIQYAD
jgi:hypothetical protein